MKTGQLPGNSHLCLGMELHFSILGEVRVTMVDYLKMVIADFLEDIMKTSSIQTEGRIFKVYPDKERNRLDK